MARYEDETADLNLTPIMNMVLVLIPLMLLSVVFLSITVIDVTMPQRSAGAPQQDGEPPKRLQLMISRQGFWILPGEMPLPPVPGCPTDGVTICLKNPDAEIEVEKHNWLALYNKLIELKLDPMWADHEQIEIVAGTDIPFGVLVKAMDISRFQLVPNAEGESAMRGKALASDADLDESVPVRVEREVDGQRGLTELEMFPLVVLGLPITQ